MAESGKRVDRSMVRRALCLIALFLAAGAALVFVLFRLQILDYSFYRQKVLEQMTYETEVLPERGIIYDRNGNILASNTTVYLIFISPQDIIDAMAEARAAETDAEAKTSYRTAYAWTSEGGVVYDGIRMNELIARALSEILGVVLHAEDLGQRAWSTTPSWRRRRRSDVATKSSGSRSTRKAPTASAR